MSLDFTVAITPSTTSIENELSYIKSAILYSDKINLISPLAYLFSLITAGTKETNVQKLIKLIKKILPLIKEIDRETYERGTIVFGQLSAVMSTRFNNIPLPLRLKFTKQLKAFIDEMTTKTYDMIGTDESQDLRKLIDNNQINILPFQHDFDSSTSFVVDFCKMLTKSLKNSYPLFDELSNNIIKHAIGEKVITISPIEREKIIHTGVVNNYMQRLPSFENATFDELLDIKKELRDPLVRFRGKMHEYSESIKTAPWDKDFDQECNILYNKEVAPTLLELEEATKENSFRKNLGRKFLTEDGLWKSYGFLVVGITAPGVIQIFNETMSDQQALLNAGASSVAFISSRVAAAYKDYKEKQEEIEKNNLYFYYKSLLAQCC